MRRSVCPEREAVHPGLGKCCVSFEKAGWQKGSGIKGWERLKRAMGKKSEANSDGSNWSDLPSDEESDDDWADDDDDRRGSRGGLQGRGGKSAGKSVRRGGGGTSSRSGLEVGGKGRGGSGSRAGPDGRPPKDQMKAPSAIDDEEDEDVDDIDDEDDGDGDGDGDGGSQDGDAAQDVTEEWEFVLPDFPREPSSICWYAKSSQIPSAHP